eukprot:FN602463.1.p1 GENE.FN602463.1~~FN602463.1.p1  ORF type:complete len:62 (-),score=0.41 FN602463.1:49-234(-)
MVLELHYLPETNISGATCLTANLFNEPSQDIDDLAPLVGFQNPLLDAADQFNKEAPVTYEH